jgi:hypothetical protein
MSSDLKIIRGTAGLFDARGLAAAQHRVSFIQGPLINRGGHKSVLFPQ